jgi:hypothetical protein
MLYFNIDVPSFLSELQKNATTAQSYVMKAPMNILKTKLAMIAERAIELDDPQLNILMLETKLYEVEHNDIQKLIQKQKDRINGIKQKPPRSLT